VFHPYPPQSILRTQETSILHNHKSSLIHVKTVTAMAIDAWRIRVFRYFHIKDYPAGLQGS
jgi:hypothetical protein